MKRFLTLYEVAEMLQVHPNTVYRWAREGKIRALHVGATWRIPEEAIDELKA
jgi:excisionase family DNA binding protein